MRTSLAFSLEARATFPLPAVAQPIVLLSRALGPQKPGAPSLRFTIPYLLFVRDWHV
jgi:hypothetical protein